MLLTGIGYFSMEFGVAEVLPIYSAAWASWPVTISNPSDLGLPLIGVGLNYRSGYFRQSLSADGWQHENYPALDPGPTAAPADPARGSPVLVELPMPESRVLRARIWSRPGQASPVAALGLRHSGERPRHAQRHRPALRRGPGTPDQAGACWPASAGAGDPRVPAIEGPAERDVFHANEGHAGFLGLERVREYMAQTDHLDFDTALAIVRASTLFTTHTPVPAGIDRFPLDMVERYFGGDADDGLCRGRGGAGALASGRARPVEVQHGPHGAAPGSGPTGVAVARPGQPGDVQRPVARLPRRGADRVHHQRRARGPTWAAPEWMDLGLDRRLSRAPCRRPDDVDGIQGVDSGHLVDPQPAAPRSWWRMCGAGCVGRGWSAGAIPAELGWIATAFDPDVLTVGFARRVPTCKRLTLMLRDPQRLEALLLDEERPVQLIVAGSRTRRRRRKALIQQIVRFADRQGCATASPSLPDYDISMARLLYWGCDVAEQPAAAAGARGTSGMKSASTAGSTRPSGTAGGTSGTTARTAGIPSARWSARPPRRPGIGCAV